MNKILPDFCERLLPSTVVAFINAHSQLIKYLLVGGLNTLFGYGVFALFIYSGLHYTLAVLLSTILGILFNFRTFGAMVFNNRSWRNLWKFFLVYGVLYLFNIVLIYLFSKFIQNVYLSGLCSLLFVAMGGYFMNKRFVYENN